MPIVPQVQDPAGAAPPEEIPLTEEEELDLLEAQLAEEEAAAGVAAGPESAVPPGIDPAGTAQDPGQMAAEIGALLRGQADQIHQQIEEDVQGAAAQIGEAIMAYAAGQDPATLDPSGQGQPAL